MPTRTLRKDAPCDSCPRFLLKTSYGPTTRGFHDVTALRETQRSIATFTLYKLRWPRDRASHGELKEGAHFRRARRSVILAHATTLLLAPTQSWALLVRCMIEIGVPCSRDCQYWTLPCSLAPMPFLPIVTFPTTSTSNVNGALRSRAATPSTTRP